VLGAPRILPQVDVKPSLGTARPHMTQARMCSRSSTSRFLPVNAPNPFFVRSLTLAYVEAALSAMTEFFVVDLQDKFGGDMAATNAWLAPGRLLQLSWDVRPRWQLDGIHSPPCSTTKTHAAHL